MGGTPRTDGPHRRSRKPAAPLQRGSGPGCRHCPRRGTRTAVGRRPPALHAALQDGVTETLVPAWARDPAIGSRLINARSETVAEKPAFRAAYRRRRCLVPADGFYEWQRRGGTRQPWLFGLRAGAPFAFAGLWERWTAPEGPGPAGSLFGPEPGNPVETFTILTTAANATVGAVHSRMPVILPPDAWGPWLAGEDVPPGPYPADEMHAHPVSMLVNKAANDDPRCVEPASLD